MASKRTPRRTSLSDSQHNLSSSHKSIARSNNKLHDPEEQEHLVTSEQAENGNVTNSNVDVDTESLKGEKSKVVKLKRPDKKSFREWTKQQWIVLIALLATFSMSNSAFSMLAPFFPEEALRLGLTEFQVAAVFAIYEIICFLMTPVWGVLITKVGPRTMCIVGSAFSGGCCIVFGLTHYASGNLFLGLCLTIRAIEGNGVAMLDVAAISILMKTFPGHTSFIMGLLETVGGLGFVLGPLLGGGLYAVGGFVTPFVVVGVIILISAVIQFFYIERYTETRSHATNFLKLLLIPGLFVMFLHNTFASATFNYLEPTLSPWMVSSFGISVTTVGFIFAGWSGSYTICAPIVGKIADKGFVYTPMMVGLFSCGVLFLFLGPSPLFNFIFEGERHYWLVILVCVVMGIFGSGIYVPPYQASVNLLFVNGYEDTIGTYGLVSGMLTCSYSLGAFSGPLISGILTEKYGFEWAVTYMGFALIVMGSIMATFLIIMRVLKKPLVPEYEEETKEDNSESTNNNNEETTPGDNCSSQSACTL